MLKVPHDNTLMCDFLCKSQHFIVVQLPALLLDFMASRRAGSELHCEDFNPHKQPPDCRDAYSDVVWWSTSTSFFTNSVLTFLMVRRSGFH
jgi:hypothetical protein